MKTKKLFLISQGYNNVYDTYDSAVVCAYDEESAKKIHPTSIDKDKLINLEETTDRYIYNKKNEKKWNIAEWVKPEHVTVKEIGIASEDIPINSVVCASYKAG